PIFVPSPKVSSDKMSGTQGQALAFLPLLLSRVALQLAVDGAGCDPQKPCRKGFVALRMSQGLMDQRSFHFLQRCPQPNQDFPSSASWPSLHGVGQVIQLNVLSPSEHDRALERMLQLANVSWPGVAFEDLSSVGRETADVLRVLCGVEPEKMF